MLPLTFFHGPDTLNFYHSGLKLLAMEIIFNRSHIEIDKIKNHGT